MIEGSFLLEIEFAFYTAGFYIFLIFLEKIQVQIHKKFLVYWSVKDKLELKFLLCVRIR